MVGNPIIEIRRERCERWKREQSGVNAVGLHWINAGVTEAEARRLQDSEPVVAASVCGALMGGGTSDILLAMRTDRRILV